MCAKKTATTKPSTGNKLHQQQQLHQQQPPTNSSSSSSSGNLNKNRDKKLIKSNSMVDNKNDLKQQQQQQLSSTGLLVVSKKKTNSMNNLTQVASTPTTTIPLTSTTTTSTTTTTTPNVLVSEKIGAVKSKASTGTTITATSSTSVSKTMKKSKSSVGEIGIGDGGGGGVAVVVTVGGKINDNNGKQEKTNDAKTNTIDHDKSSGNNKLNRMNDHKTNSKRDEIKSKANNKNKSVDNVEKLLSDKSNEKPVVVAVSDVKTVTSSMANVNDTTAKGAVDVNTTKSNASASKKPVNKVKTKVDKTTDNQKKCVKPKAVKIIKKVAKGKDCKTTIKISNELKNLGVNMAKSASAISSCDETMPNEVKTSICEMVKTKTRICVTPQSTISSKSQTTHLQDMVKIKAADVKLNKESQEKKIKSSDAKIKSKKVTSLEIATVANQQEKLNEQKTEDVAAKFKKESKPKEAKLKKEKSNLEKATDSTAGKNVQSSTSNNMNLEESKKDFPSDASATPKKKYIKKQKDSIIDKQIDINNTPMAPASSAASTPVKRKYVKKKKPGDESEKTSADNSSVESSKKKKTVQSDKVEPKNGLKKINTPKEPKESKVKKAKIVQKDEPPPSAIKPHKEILKTGFEVEYSLEKPRSDELLKTEPSSDKETKITVKDINSLLEQKPIKQTEILIKEENNVSAVISMEKEKELTTNKTTALAVILPAIATKIKRKYIRKNLPTSSQPIIKKSSKKQSELPVADTSTKPKPELKTSNEIKLENKVKPSGNVSDLKAPANIIVNTEIESQKNLTKSDIKEKLMEIPTKVEQQQKKEAEKCLSDLQSKKNFIGKLKSDEEFSKDSITKAAHADETTTSSKKQTPLPLKSNKKSKTDKDPLKTDTSDCIDSTDNSDSEDDYSGASFVKPRKPPVRGNLRARKVKQFGPKRTRVASLNAIAKVHCLYENEARSALETNIHNAEQMAIAAQKQKCGYGSTSDDEDDDANVNSDKDMQAVIPRSLRTAPGLRGIGKHWEMDSMSSEIDSDSDASQKNIKEDNKMKSKKKPIVKKLTSKQQAMALAVKAKSLLKKVIKKSPKHRNSDDSQDDKYDKDEDNEIVIKKNKKQQAAALKKLTLATAAAAKKKNESIKRKKAKDDDKIGDKNVVAKKRMASMNASAILAANYEVDNYATKLETSSEESSDSSNNEEDDHDIEPPTTKKDKKDLKRELQEPRPKSTTVKIDTDVTITGEFYVNSAVGSQETIRKTLYHRTAYSVTEERVVRPPIQEPPKSYTPLSALGNMRPPGGQLPPDPCMTAQPDQFHPQPPPIFDPQMGPIPPYQYPPQQPNPHPNFPPHSMPSTSSAFYSPQQMHRDPMGYYPGYQPAGPLISSHLLPQPIPPPLESDQTQSSQSSASTADNTDPDVIITGGDIAPRPQPYRYGPPAPDPNPYSRHPMHYPYQPNYYSPYGQPPPHQQPPPQEMCYQPYPYHQPKYYTSNAPPTYARRYMPTGYYQPPLDYRPPPQNVPQPPAGSQLVPAGPSGHMDPHYPSPQFYSPGYSPNGGAQCYNRNLQPPYLDTTQYHHHNTTSCPCPMQSCPKNGHGTGPINNAKGPVSSNNNLSTDNNAPMTTASANNSTSIISCKIENILASDIRIKPENDKTIDCKQQRDSYDKVAIAPQPNYSLNVKVLEVPENSVSPSRGSIGLQLPPTQCEAVQPSELNSDNISLSQRKARIGKTMERERQQQILLHGFQTAVSFISPPTTPVLKQEYEVKQEMDVKKEKDYEENAVEDDYTQMSDDKMDLESDIKVEPVMVEDEMKMVDDDIIDEKPKESENSYVDRNTINLLNESSDECLDYSMDSTTKRKLQDHDDVIELSDNSTVAELPSSTVKRRKLFEKPALIAVKKSPPNSYKRLIKKSQPPPSYLTSSSKSRLITSNLNRIVNKSNLKRRCIFKSKAAIKKMKMAVKKRKLAQKKKEQEEAEAEEEESCSEKQSEVAENESVVQDAEEDTPSEAEKVNSNDDTSNEAPGESHEDKQLSDDNSEYSGKSNIDMTIDRVAKGYFSESEILSRLSKYRKTKSQKKLDAKRSKSEGNRSKSKKLDKDVKKPSDTTEEKTKEKCKKKQKKKDKVGASSSSSNNSNNLVNNNCNNCKDKNQNTKTKTTKTKDNKDKSIPNSTTTNTTKKSKKTNNKPSTIAASKARSKTNNETLDFATDIETLTTNTIAIQSPPTTPTKRKQTTDKSEKKKKKPKTNKIIEEESSSNSREVETIEASTNQTDNGDGIEILSDVTPVVPLIVETILSPPSPLPLPLLTTSTASPVKVKTLLLNETDVENNNDECFVDNNSKLKNKQQFQESLALYKTAAGWVTGNKVPGKRGRKGKFGNRKRHRLAPLEDIVIPRSSSIPRWSNGWQWEGEPYQAYVFLNSDDAPVVRTCYASMRHQEGDVIRPRDCVLMRAGNKKNELPYVAKVAQLWENPEDGEMMLSVFWYYRPEHTEIGRQENDAPDEVFASRHKDHNSVACIEDKCYVVTFREYCRYRRQLKATEENREEPPSVVPRLLKPERRTVPPATSPELIMFCRRVYDFRKRKL